MRRPILLAAAVAAGATLLPPIAGAQQRFADLGTCPTAGGAEVLDCRVGYRTFGRLNERGDNAILLPTWHGGRSETMTFLLGPGGWVDTTRYFAILMDALGNGVSTSPSNSRTQPGARFPRLTMEDMVGAQHRVVTGVLGIRRLHAVIGWSMGGMQAIEWALHHPDAVGRVVSVAGSPRMGSYDMYWLRSMLTLLELADRAGLPRDTLAVRLAELWHTVATTPALENRPSRDSVRTAIAAEARADWLDFHPEDNRLHLEAVAALDALGEARGPRGAPLPPTLLVYVPEDHVTTAESFREFARVTGADLAAVASPCGHMAPVCDGAAIGGRVRQYLDGASVATRNQPGR
jgi:homoserine O-acetyltransferase